MSLQEKLAKKGSLFGQWLVDSLAQFEEPKEDTTPTWDQAKPSATTSSIHDDGSLDDQTLTLKGHSNNVLCVAFSPTEQLLATGSSDKTIRLWNVESGAHVATLSDHTHDVYSVAFSPNGTIVASGSRDSTIMLWAVKTQGRIATVRAHTNTVSCVAFSPDGRRLVTGSADRTIRLWSLRSIDDLKRGLGMMLGHTDWVNAVAFSPDGKTVASGSKDKTIRLWNPTSRQNIATFKGHLREIRTIAFSPNGEYIASGSWDKTVRLWDVTARSNIGTVTRHSDTVSSVVFSPDGRHLASGSWDKTVRLFDMASKSHILSLQGHYEDGLSIAFSPDSTRLAFTSKDSTVKVCKLPLDVAGGPQGDTAASVLTGLSESKTDNPQEATTPDETLIPLNNDITGSISLENNTLIGFGGFGEVFSGVHKDHGKVALKKPRRVLNEALIRRFLREVDLWCSVSHPHVLPCLGMCRVGLDVYVVSPFIENGDLLSCMAKGKDLNYSKLLFEVAEALTHLHHRGIVHGDVKAQNILLSDKGSALLCDFGLAKAFDTMSTSTETKGAGSVRWMAPELILGESRSMASDVYSLGITIAEVLSGRAPFYDIADNVAVMFHVASRDGRPPKEPSHSPGGRSYATLWDTAEKCWVKDVKARPYMAQVLAMLFPLTREMA